MLILSQSSIMWLAGCAGETERPFFIKECVAGGLSIANVCIKINGLLENYRQHRSKVASSVAKLVAKRSIEELEQLRMEIIFAGYGGYDIPAPSPDIKSIQHAQAGQVFWVIDTSAAHGAVGQSVFLPGMERMQDEFETEEEAKRELVQLLKLISKR